MCRSLVMGEWEAKVPSAGETIPQFQHFICGAVNALILHASNYGGRNIMNRRTTLILAFTALLCSAVALPAGDAAAQQKQKVSYQTPAANTKYTQQHAIEV